MTTQKINNLKVIIVSSIIGFIMGSVITGFSVYQHINTEYYKLHMTNIGMMIFVKDKIYNLSEMKSME
ncbi:hypothetical protein UFOVP1655_54 [uncultured Caudovirales phage]|jgi:hypothetical protein|uniref:Uncharacterized protein n=1 Tax=uncultured Caudovirales phage TaxID=2100421 RepID=A0A6J5T5S4_9CAUD|nr:hypothetical protein UFOVP1655_54 [uncultured Caudovirales phage]